MEYIMNLRQVDQKKMDKYSIFYEKHQLIGFIESGKTVTTTE